MNYFLFGHPKSGTTWLQMICNSHPDLSCPPEDQLAFWAGGLDGLCKSYNEIKTEIDERTGKQGVVPLTTEDSLAMFRNVITWLMREDNSGINDNGVIENLKLYKSLFPEALFVHIIRDPREITMSSWVHNKRVEPGFIARAHSLEEWAESSAKLWVENVTAGRASVERQHTVLYKDLCEHPVQAMTELFSFLGVDSAPEVIEEIRGKTDFKSMKKDNPFFRKGKASGEEGLSSECVDIIEQIAGKEMRFYGFIR